MLRRGLVGLDAPRREAAPQLRHDAQVRTTARVVEQRGVRLDQEPEVHQRVQLVEADQVAAVYRKSLLYLVSNALEVYLRTPILGLANVLDADYAGWDGTSSVGEALRQWRSALDQAGLRADRGITVVDRQRVTTAVDAKGAPAAQINAAHGAFDNDVDTLSATLRSILGGDLRLPVDDLRGF